MLGSTTSKPCYYRSSEMGVHVGIILNINHFVMVYTVYTTHENIEK